MRPPKIENAPTCYRAPRGPTRSFYEKYRKIPPARNSTLPEFTPKCPENTPPPQKKNQNSRTAHFRHFLGISGVFLGVPEFRPRGYLFGIFRGNSGRGVLKPKTKHSPLFSFCGTDAGTVWQYFYDNKGGCWKPLSIINSARLSAPDPKSTSEPHPSHVRTTSEPHPNRIRNNGRSYGKSAF